jgi:hypothetical protein
MYIFSLDKSGLGFDQSAFLADDSPLEVKKVFDQWIERAVQRYAYIYIYICTCTTEVVGL